MWAVERLEGKARVKDIIKDLSRKSFDKVKEVSNGKIIITIIITISNRTCEC